MAYLVYVIKAIGRNLRYVGLTSKEIDEKIREHNSGESGFTRRYKWKLLYYERGYCRKCAREREKFLKSGQGRKILDLIEIDKSEEKKGNSS